ncbi:hypothetical protein TL16_g06296 [Triparma laevis f. inornata]|uniref:Uncharacterized protein n=1 Tax=Triparma laevis f. inornata TaxID=1714386 RepID=A0A9W7AJ54_9STRA|nr:hypothetical protein TL16_g06296 [Triparma laevis f. inornata]
MHMLNVFVVFCGLLFIYFLRLEVLKEKEMRDEGGVEGVERCDFYVLGLDKVDRKGFQSNFVYKRRPLKVLSDAALTAENGSCNIDGDTCELPKILPDYLNNFQNFTVDGVIIDDLGEAISRGLVESVTFDWMRKQKGLLNGLSNGSRHKGDVYLKVLKGVFLVDLNDNDGWVNGRCYISEGEAVYLPNWKNKRGGGIMMMKNMVMEMGGM